LLRCVAGDAGGRDCRAWTPGAGGQKRNMGGSVRCAGGLFVARRDAPALASQAVGLGVHAR